MRRTAGTAPDANGYFAPCDHFCVYQTMQMNPADNLDIRNTSSIRDALSRCVGRVGHGPGGITGEASLMETKELPDRRCRWLLS
jgi:hypothetical protein